MRLQTETPMVNFARTIIACAAADWDNRNALEIASHRWGSTSAPASFIRAAVQGGGTGTWGSELVEEHRRAGTEFFDAVREASIVGRIGSLRRVPLRVPLVSATGSSAAFWTGEGKARPVTSSTFSRASLDSLILSAVVVVTKELLASSDPAAETAIRRDMLRAAVEGMDRQFIDPAISGVAGISPASVTNGITPIAATADPAADLKALIADFSGDLATAAFVTTPELGAALSGAERPYVGARGGELLGVECVTSRYVPAGIIALVDAASIALGEGDASFMSSGQGTVEMEDAPIGDATTGTGTTLVSMFQNRLEGIKLQREINWQRVRAGAVSLITGASY